jgi:hypothetical protein
LSITASSTTANYGVAVPAITPIYNGFVNGDMPASVGTGATVRATAKRWFPKLARRENNVSAHVVPA